MELLTFILCAYGLTQILVYSDLPALQKLRPPKEAGGGYGKVFHCPMCMGFHVGWFLLWRFLALYLHMLQRDGPQQEEDVRQWNSCRKR